jgi:hypothetical protein
MNKKSQVTITIMFPLLVLSVLYLVRNGSEEYIGAFLLSVFSAACIAAAIARALYNKHTDPTCNPEDRETLPSSWQYFKFLVAFFIGSVVIAATIMLLIGPTSLESMIWFFSICLLGIPVFVVAGLVAFWILK